MITRIRKSAGNIFVRIGLMLIALSFVGLGGAMYVRHNVPNAVDFSQARSVTRDEFDQIKIDLIKQLQRNNYSEQDIDENAINQAALMNVINRSMISYLADSYNFDVSDDKIVEQIKSNPAFHEQGKFSLKKFKIIFQGAFKTPEQYAQSLKEEMINSLINNIFANAINVPDIQLETILKSVAQKKRTKIVSMSQEHRNASTNLDIDEAKVTEYYNDNIHEFVVPEKRQFSYAVISDKIFDKKINTSQGNLKAYFKENLDNYDSDEFDKMSNQVKKDFIEEQKQRMLNKLMQDLESDIAAGLTFKELAQKHNFTIKQSPLLSKDEVQQKPDFIEISDAVFDLEVDELSYPIENEQMNMIYILSVNQVNPQDLQTIDQVRSHIVAQLQKKNILENNVKHMLQIRNKYNASTEQSLNMKDGILVSNGPEISKYQFSTGDLQSVDLPEELVAEAVSLTFGESSRIYMHNGKIIFVHIVDQRLDSGILKKIKNDQNLLSNYRNMIKEGLYVELLRYLIQQNNMQINL